MEGPSFLRTHMRSRKLFSVGFVSMLVVLAAVSAAGFAGTGLGPNTLAQSDTGDEPNDSRETATAIEKRTNVEGSVNGSDVDFLAFEASEDQIIRVIDGFAAVGGGTNVTLLAPGGETLGSGTAGATTAGTAEIGAKAPTDGTYYLKVAPVSGGTSYSLSVATTDPDSFESNENQANATSITAGESVNGTITSGTNIADDQDWFAIEVQEDQNLTATLEKTDAGLNFGSPETGQNLRVDVFDSDGNRLSGNETVADSGNVLSTVTQQVTANETGTYYVRVSSIDGASGVIGFAGYSLTTDVSGADQPTTEDPPTKEPTTGEPTTEEPTETTTKEPTPETTTKEPTTAEPSETTTEEPITETTARTTAEDTTTETTTEKTITEEPSQSDGTEESDESIAYYQVDFVVGEPIENLRGPNGTYENNQLLRFLHGSTDEPVTRRSEGEFITDASLADRIESNDITVENGSAMVEFTVAEGESVTLTLASYEKVGPGWSPETESEQVFVDSQTRTFESGTHTFTVDLPEKNSGTANDDE
jgi:hypothetical protein